MKKEYLLFTIIFLVIFLTGLLIGKEFNQVGRYSLIKVDKQVVVLDTKTATTYIQDGDKKIFVRNFKEDFENKK